MNLNSPETQFAIQSVRIASQLVKMVQAEMVKTALTKEDRSPVTVADFVSQALVGWRLAEAFPNDPLVGEEDATALRNPEAKETLELVTRFVLRLAPDATPETVCRWIDHGSGSPSRRFWTLDPIDGTKGFLRGDQYAVALALIVEGQVRVGVLGCPNLAIDNRREASGPGLLVMAALGEGAWATHLDGQAKDFTRLRVSDLRDPARARLLRSFESGHTNVGQIDLFAQTLGVWAEPVRMDSQAKYAVLAAGGGELYLRLISPSKPDYREKIWDQAAGSLIVEEAGGRVTDLDGKRLDFNSGRTLARSRGLLASNGWLHQAALEAVRRIGA